MSTEVSSPSQLANHFACAVRSDSDAQEIRPTECDPDWARPRLLLCLQVCLLGLRIDLDCHGSPRSGWPEAPVAIIDADIATIAGATDKVIRVTGPPDWLLAVGLSGWP
jgi:hypothetical protein